MNSDHHFWIGSTHTVCEDYAISGQQLSGEPYAIVCDGCSSSTDTDFGARILAKAAERCLPSIEQVSMELFAENVLMQAKIIRDAAQLHPNALDVTLLIATPKLVRCYGDGAVATIKENGAINVTMVEFPSGAPLYLNYLLDPVRYSGYRKEYGDKRRLTSFEISPEGLHIFLEAQVEEQPSVQPAPIGVDICVPSDAVAVAIMSDGVLSVMEDVYSQTSRTEIPVSAMNVLTKLLSFKNYQGVFVKRRAKRFIKDCETLCWQNADDISIGVVKL